MSDYQGPVYGASPTPKKKNSVMSIVSLVLSILGFPIVISAIASIVVSIIDLNKDKQKEYKHILSIIALVLSILAILFNIVVSSDTDSESKKNIEVSETSETPTSKEEKEDTTSEVKETSISKDDFIASCEDLKENYKSILRNPEQYEGHNYYFTCYVSDVRESWGTKYYTVYYVDTDEAQKRVDDGWDDSLEEAYENVYDYDYSVWLFDDRDSESEDYIKILDGDVIIVYGTFDGTSESKNSLTKETGEQMSLNIKYVELLAE